MSEKPKSKKVELELVAALPKALDATLSRHKKNISVFDKGMKKAGAEFFGYAYLKGREFNLIAAALPGGFRDWMKENLPEEAESKIFRYREFATLMEPKIEEALALPATPIVGAATPMVGVSQPLGLLGKSAKLKQKALPAIIAAVAQVMERKTMMGFMEDEKLLKAPAPDGGYRPDAEMVKEFLAAVHPDLNGKVYSELEETIQAEFRKWLATRPEPPADIAKRANDQGEAHKQAMLAAITGKWAMAMSKKLRADNLALAEKWVDKLKSLK